jgi:hypothetical protein
LGNLPGIADAPRVTNTARGFEIEVELCRTWESDLVTEPVGRLKFNGFPRMRAMLSFQRQPRAGATVVRIASMTCTL